MAYQNIISFLIHATFTMDFHMVAQHCRLLSPWVYLFQHDIFKFSMATDGRSRRSEAS